MCAVEWKKLGDVTSINRGVRVVKSELAVEGVCPVYQNSLIPLGYKNIPNRTSNTTFIICAGAAGEIGYSKCDFWAADDCSSIDCNQGVISKYVYYFLLTKQHYLKTQVRKASIPRLSNNAIKDILIPIPTLAKQQEIVSHLDTFTTLISNLESELDMRRKQYEHYRNQLLDFDGVEGVEWKTLGEVAINRDRMRKPITASKRVAGIYPYYGASGIVDYVEGYIFDGNYLLISEDGANLIARSTPIAFPISGKTWVNNHAHVLEFNNLITQRLIEIYLNSIDLTKYISGGAQPKLNQENLNSILIPIPSLATQQEIVEKLDAFENLIQSLETEVKLRKKQYEYYREKLLTFD